MCSISGSNYLQGAFQEGGNLSFHLQVIRDQIQVVVGEGGGSWKGMYSRFVKSKGEEGERTQAGGNLYISAYLEVVITVSGFIFPCITGCDGPLGRVWHGSAINNITNVQNQR